MHKNSQKHMDVNKIKIKRQNCEIENVQILELYNSSTFLIRVYLLLIIVKLFGSLFQMAGAVD